MLVLLCIVYCFPDFSLSFDHASSPLSTKAAFNLWVLGGRGSAKLLYLLKEVKKQMVTLPVKQSASRGLEERGLV